MVLAAVLGALMAVDFGGPINKAAYLFGTVALAGGQEEFMAAVMAGGMVPPLGVALAGTLFPERFTTKETPHRDDRLPDGGLLYHRGGRPLCAAGSAACHSLLHGGCIPGGGAVHAVWLCRTGPARRHVLAAAEPASVPVSACLTDGQPVDGGDPCGFTQKIPA